MGLILHPVASKQKAVDICNAFAAGAPKNVDGDVFFGVNASNIQALRKAKKEGRDWYYLDNSYLDKHRGTYFRVTKNALQCSGRGESDGKRFDALDVEIKPWRTKLGPDILVCPQSDSFMHTAVGYKGDWAMDTLVKLRSWGIVKSVRVRPWTRDKIKASIDLHDDLVNLRLLITHSSAAAITTMLEGVPAISEAGAANLMTGPLTQYRVWDPSESPDRLRFAQVLADNQWTLDEIRKGMAWRALNP